MDRREAYAQIKNLGLEGEVKRTFGRNFTQVPTAALVAMIEAENKKSTKITPATAVSSEKISTLRGAMEGECRNWEDKYKKVVTILAKFIASIPQDVLDDATAVAKTLTPEKEVKDVDFSNAEIDKMFK